MTYTDFIRTFTHLEVNILNSISILYANSASIFMKTKSQVVHLDAETARDEPSMQGKSRCSFCCPSYSLFTFPFFSCLSWELLFPGGAWGCTVEPGRKVWLQADVETTQVACCCVLLSFLCFCTFFFLYRFNFVLLCCCYCSFVTEGVCGSNSSDFGYWWLGFSFHRI